MINKYRYIWISIILTIAAAYYAKATDTRLDDLKIGYGMATEELGAARQRIGDLQKELAKTRSRLANLQLDARACQGETESLRQEVELGLRRDADRGPAPSNAVVADSEPGADTEESTDIWSGINEIVPPVLTDDPSAWAQEAP